METNHLVRGISIYQKWDSETFQVGGIIIEFGTGMMMVIMLVGLKAVRNIRVGQNVQCGGGGGGGRYEQPFSL